MRAAAVVEAKVSLDSGASFRDAGIGPQVDFLVFDGPPQTLDEDVVAPGALAIHTDLDLAGGQNLDELGRGELAALIRVEDLRCAVTSQRLLHSFYAKIGLQRDRHPPCQDASREPVQHGREID